MGGQGCPALCGVRGRPAHSSVVHPAPLSRGPRPCPTRSLPLLTTQGLQEVEAEKLHLEKKIQGLAEEAADDLGLCLDKTIK